MKPELCEWCDEFVVPEEAWNDEWESYGLRCPECGAWFRSY